MLVFAPGIYEIRLVRVPRGMVVFSFFILLLYVEFLPLLQFTMCCCGVCFAVVSCLFGVALFCFCYLCSLVGSGFPRHGTLLLFFILLFCVEFTPGLPLTSFRFVCVYRFVFLFVLPFVVRLCYVFGIRAICLVRASEAVWFPMFLY